MMWIKSSMHRGDVRGWARIQSMHVARGDHLAAAAAARRGPAKRAAHSALRVRRHRPTVQLITHEAE